MSAQPHDAARVDSPPPAEASGRMPVFPTERAERGIEMFSRFAGPAIFAIALGGLIWFLVK